MLRNIALAVSLVLVLPTLAHAQGFAGTWVNQEEREISVVLTQNPDGTVTGSFREYGESFPATGRLEKDVLLLTTDVDGDKMQIRGLLQGDRLVLEITYPDDPGEVDREVYVRAGATPRPPADPAPPGGWGQPGTSAPPTPTPPQNPLGQTPGANPLAPPPDPLVGTFADDKVTVELAGKSPDYTGTLSVGGPARYPLQAKGTPADLQGTFTVNGSAFRFTCTLSGDVLALTSDGTTYRLQRRGAPAAPQNPLGGTPGGWGEGQPQPPHTPPAAGGPRYRHPIGFSFVPPQGWRALEQGGGVQLMPPDPASNAQGPTEAYLVLGQPAPGVSRADDPKVVQYLNQRMSMLAPFLQPKGAPSPVQAGARAGTFMAWSGQNPMSGLGMLAESHMVLIDGFAYGLLSIGETKHVDRRRAAVRAAFATFDASAPELDPNLVGRWYRKLSTRTTGPDGPLNTITLLVSTLAPDGRFTYGSQLSVAGPGIGGQTDPNATQGRWAAKGGKVWFFGEGGISEYSYHIQGVRGRREMLITGAGGGQKELWTETADQQ